MNLALIDDEVEILDVLVDFFDEEGFDVKIYDSLESFEKDIDETDIILTDYSVINNNELIIEKWKKTHYVYIMTGNMDLELNNVKIFHKPFDIAGMIEFIHEETREKKSAA